MHTFVSNCLSTLESAGLALGRQHQTNLADAVCSLCLRMLLRKDIFARCSQPLFTTLKKKLLGGEHPLMAQKVRVTCVRKAYMRDSFKETSIFWRVVVEANALTWAKRIQKCPELLKSSDEMLPGRVDENSEPSSQWMSFWKSILKEKLSVHKLVCTF